MANYRPETLRRLAHEAMIHLEGIDKNARARSPEVEDQLCKDISAIEKMLLRFIKCQED